MGLFDKLRERLGSMAGGSRSGGGPGGSGGGFGGLGSATAERAAAPQDRPGAPGQTDSRDPDEVAVERYRYMLRTAPPETVEQAHAEAFAKLTPEQRRKVFEELGSAVPASERTTSDDPQSLARMATRAEMREPGIMERTLGGGRGGMGGGMGMGGMIAGTLLASVAGAFIGTAIADAFFGDEFGGEEMAGAEDMAGGDPGVDPGQEMADPGMADPGGMEDFEI